MRTDSLVDVEVRIGFQKILSVRTGLLVYARVLTGQLVNVGVRNVSSSVYQCGQVPSSM